MQGVQRMRSLDCGNLSAFPLVPAADQGFHLSNENIATFRHRLVKTKRQSTYSNVYGGSLTFPLGKSKF